MIHIQKADEPEAFREWKKANPDASYGDMPGDVVLALRNALLDEQGFVCCFCGCGLGPVSPGSKLASQRPLKKGDGHNIRNAHIIPQSVEPGRALDYANICASCNTDKHKDQEHCDARQANNRLPISPLQQDCLSFFSFDADGKIYPNSQKSPEDQQRAQQTIDILGLDDPALCHDRKESLKTFSDSMEELQQVALRNLSRRNRHGAFTPFYFVVLSYYGSFD